MAADRVRTGLIGLGVLAAGALAGAAAEELLYRRVVRVPDPEHDEPIGSVPGRTMWVTAADGTRLYTRRYGPSNANAAIVFAHGIVENHVIWHYLVRDLRSDGRYALVAYDARGHGSSGPVHGPDGITPFDTDTLGRDLAAVVEQTTSGPVVVVGHSLGGMTALTQLVLDQPERERLVGAVLVNTTFAALTVGPYGIPQRLAPLAQTLRRFINSDPRRADRLRFAANDLSTLLARSIFGANASPRHVAVAFHMYETTSAQTLAAASDLLAYDVTDDLARIDIPVLVIGGSRDVLTPVHFSRHMAETIPDAELVILDGCGHMAPFERHADVTAHVRKFAERVLG